MSAYASKRSTRSARLARLAFDLEERVATLERQIAILLHAHQKRYTVDDINRADLPPGVYAALSADFWAKQRDALAETDDPPSGAEA